MPRRELRGGVGEVRSQEDDPSIARAIESTVLRPLSRCRPLDQQLKVSRAYPNTEMRRCGIVRLEGGPTLCCLGLCRASLSKPWHYLDISKRGNLDFIPWTQHTSRHLFEQRAQLNLATTDLSCNLIVIRHVVTLTVSGGETHACRPSKMCDDYPQPLHDFMVPAFTFL